MTWGETAARNAKETKTVETQRRFAFAFIELLYRPFVFESD